MLVFLLNLVRRQSVLLLYTSVLAPYLSLLDPWFFPFSSCSLLLLVTSVCFRFILCCHSTQSLFPSVHFSPILSSSYVFISMPVPSSHCSFQISPFPLLFNPLLCPELILSSTSIQSPFPPPQDQSFSSFLPFLLSPLNIHPSPSLSLLSFHINPPFFGSLLLFSYQLFSISVPVLVAYISFPTH